MSFAIKEGYVERPQPAYFTDEGYGIVSQPDVYPFAASLADEALIDLGCGRALKLGQIHASQPDWRVVGVDHGENIRWCRKHHDWGEWLELDLEDEHEIDAAGAVIVCADVIEHLRDPRPLIATIRSSGCLTAVLSTPERDLMWGTDHCGPPPNDCHAREWNRAELRQFLESEGLRIDNLALTVSDNAGGGMRTILAVVR